ncbi:M28 family peptidase [Chloroflexota bacterium]
MIHKDHIVISIENLRMHISNLEGVRHWRDTPDKLGKAGDYIQDMLVGYGHTVSRHTFQEDGREYHNILGLQNGTRQPKKMIMIMAHYDTVADSPGANDNASGVAGMLELARVLGKYLFRKSILYVGINLEEGKERGVKGTPTKRGSTALAAHAHQEDWQLEGVINLEEIAYAGDDIPQKKVSRMPVKVSEIGNFVSVVGNEISADMVQGYITVVDQFCIPLPCLSMVVPGNGETLPDTRRSDHAPFWDQGFPAIVLTDTANFRYPHYHQASDTLDKLNLKFTSLVCQAAGELTSQMAEIEKP